MVEFIILGIVPGTSVQITLSHITTLLWILFILYLLRIARRAPNDKE